MMDRKTQRIVSKIVLVTAILWLVLWLTSYKPETVIKADPAINIETSTVSYQRHDKMVTLFGQIKPLDPIHIDAEISARITSLAVKNGAKVKKGDLIATLDTTKLDIQSASLKQTIDKTNSQIASLTQEYDALTTLIEHDKKLLENAQELLKRYQSLSERYQSQTGLNQRQDTVSQRAKALQQNQTNQNNILFRIDQLKSDLVTHNLHYLNNQLDIEKATLTAVEDGMVTDLSHQKGDLLQKGEAICMLINPKNIYVHAYVPSIYFNQVSPGQIAYMQDDASMTLVLKTIDHQVDNQSAHLDGLFHFQLLPEDPMYPIGQVVSIRMALPLDIDTFTAPESSIYEERYVYQVDPNSQLLKTKVAVHGTLLQQNQTLYLLSSPDILNGNQILISRLPNPKTGLRVNDASS
ncbi:MAG: biotin/lipoyl-binding protein [Pseudomonadota bacterium]|nr:biotin/lipoyl-binding protein [Pseudomonadota bacterium]